MTVFPSRSASFVCLVLFGMASQLVACATLGSLVGSYAIDDCAGAILDTEFIEAGQLFRNRVRYDSLEPRDGEPLSVGYDIITEVTTDGITVVALTTFGNKALSIRQRGTEVETVNHLGPAAVLAPMNLLRDLHRVHFLRTRLVDPERPEAKVEVGGFEVEERLEPSRVVRRVKGAEDTDLATVIVTSDAATIERRSCSYRARFVTLLPGGP